MPIPLDLNIEQWPIDRLRPNARNARTHSKKQIGQLGESISKFGLVCPILADEQHVIIAGHGRLEAARKLGFETVPVIKLTHLNEAQKKALAIADNKIASNAGWDLEILADELRLITELSDELDFDGTITGFETPEIDALFSDLAETAQNEPEEDVIEPCADVVTRTGDVWVLGNHRAVCGDATSEATYSLLLGDYPLPRMVITDPPYNVRVNGHITGRGKSRHQEFAQASGEMSEREFEAFLKAVMTLLSQHTADGSLHYVFMDWRHVGEIVAAGKAVYQAFLNMCVWTKTNSGQGSFYRSAHELVFVFRKGMTSHTNNVQLGKFGRNRSNVWPYAGVNTFRAGRAEDLAAHPTVKPVAMIVDAIKDATKRGESILDAFLGSGSALLAAEKTGRRCFGIEIEPKYVDVTIRRWQALTGKDAACAATGRTFAEIEAERLSAITQEAS
jgi:DNA modification methylase